jgi:hypothetical protein
VRIIRRKENIKEKKTVMIWCSLCPNNASPEKIHPFLINSHMNTICTVDRDKTNNTIFMLENLSHQT